MRDGGQDVTWKQQAMARKKWGKYLLLMYFKVSPVLERGSDILQELSADEWSSVCELSFLAARETRYVLLYYTAIKGCGNITILQI